MQRLEAGAQWLADCVFVQGINALFGRERLIIASTETQDSVLARSHQTGISMLFSEQLHTQQPFRHSDVPVICTS